MFENNFTKKDSVAEAIEKIIETKNDDNDVPWKSGIGIERTHKPRTPEQGMSVAHNLAGKGLKKAKSMDKDDVPWKSGIGIERDHKPRTPEQGMSVAHNLAGKGLKKAKSMSKEDFSFKDQLIENHKAKQFEIELIDEKEMSPAQSKKKEEIVLSMKDREKEFKAKYGKRWKEVMYATATKMAMKEETLDEKWDDDDEDDDVKRADAELKRMKAKPIHADKKTDPDKEIGKLAKKTPKEVDEETKHETKKDFLARQHRLAAASAETEKDPEHLKRLSKIPGYSAAMDLAKKTTQKEEAEQIDEISGDLALKYKNKALGGKSIDDVSPKRQKGVTLAHRKVSQSITNVPGRHAKVAATWKEESEQIDELSKDTLGSYVKKATDAKEKNWQYADAAAKRSKTPADTKQFLKHSEKFGKRTSGLKMAADRLNKEEVELVEGDVMHTHSVHFANPETGEWQGKMLINADHDREAVKCGHDMAKKHGLKLMMVSKNNVIMRDKTLGEEVIYEAKGPETDNVPFVQNANPSSNPVTPLSRAKELAHSAMKRIKNEMLGKAGATSEEIDPNVKTTDMLRGRVKGGKKDDVGPGADFKSTKVKFTPGPK